MGRFTGKREPFKIRGFPPNEEKEGKISEKEITNDTISPSPLINAYASNIQR